MVDRLYTWDETPYENSDVSPPWKRAEDHITRSRQLKEDHSSWHDARDSDGNPVEIKCCAAKHADGYIGQFKIWESQRRELITNGRIALLVYAHDDRASVMATHSVRPFDLRDAGSVSWVNHPSMGTRRIRRIPWPKVIPLEEVEFGARHHFSEHYPEEEAEEVLFLCNSDKLIRLY